MFHEGKVLCALMEGVGGERDKTMRVLKNRFLPWMLLSLYHVQRMMIPPEERDFHHLHVDPQRAHVNIVD